MNVTCIDYLTRKEIIFGTTEYQMGYTDGLIVGVIVLLCICVLGVLWWNK